MTRPVRKVAAWNMKVGRGKAAVDGLAALIDDHSPEVVLLQEAMNYVTRIRLRFGRHWRVYAGAPFMERGNCAVMVRRSVKRGGHGKVRNRLPWRYTGQGRDVKHPGRVWRWARADGIYFLSMHRATNALSLNKAAGSEEADNLEEWFGDHAGPMIAAGDWNNLHSDGRQEAPASIARRVKAHLIVPPEGRIDYALARDVKGRGERVGKYGSDHPAVVYTLDR